MSKLSELIKQYCPNGVEYKTFETVCEYIRGVTYQKNQEANSGEVKSIPVFRANNISLSTNSLNFEEVKKILTDVKVKDEQYLKKGDILICAASGSKEHVGKVAYIFEDMNYTFGGFMAVIRCSEQLNARFLFHIFQVTHFYNI